MNLNHWLKLYAILIAGAWAQDSTRVGTTRCSKAPRDGARTELNETILEAVRYLRSFRKSALNLKSESLNPKPEA